MQQNLQNIVDVATKECAAVDQILNDQSQQIEALKDQAAGLATDLTLLQEEMNNQQINVLDELQALPQGTNEATGWVQPANAGDTGGSDPSKPHGTFTITPGEVATFSAKPGYANNNGYWYTKRKGFTFDSARLILQMFQLAFPDSASLNACEAVEWEVQHSKDGRIDDIAWQLRHPAKEGSLWTFDKRPATHGWKSTPFAVPNTLWKPGVMVPIVATSRMNDDMTFSYLGLSVAGRQYITSPIVQPIWADQQSNYLSVGFQLDTNKSATPYSVKVKSFRVIYAG